VEGEVTAILCVLFLLVAADQAGAQAAANAPRWDVAANTGVFIGRPDVPDDLQNYADWYHSPTLGISAGRYVTTNLKVEGELAVSREGSTYSQRVVQVPGLGPRPISVEQLTRINGASAALVWQFFDNQWVHPFVMAGATLDFDRERVHIFRQSFYEGDPRVRGNEVVVTEDRFEDAGTTERVRALLGGGLKLYLLPNAFFRTDMRIGMSAASGGHVAFRFGFGADF
jgi:Outer membrane protein beta-barrel domain